jgi:hypothetical protein
MPESKWNGVPFDQDGLERRKLRFLVRHGYEVANHTVSHRSLADLGGDTLRWEMAEAVRGIRRLTPRATMDTLALPYGAAPKDRKLWPILAYGRDQGTVYRNRCILLASGGPAAPFLHRTFDYLQVPRIEPEPGNVERWIEQLNEGGTMAGFVSDGKPDIATIPRSRLADLNRERLKRTRLVIDDSEIKRSSDAGRAPK